MKVHFFTEHFNKNPTTRESNNLKNFTVVQVKIEQ